MQLTRRQDGWDPVREIEDLSSRMGRIFGLTGLARWAGNGERELLASTDWSPACNVSESEKEYRISAELPCVKKEDVHVTLEDGALTIQGERRSEKEEEGVKFHRREVVEGKFLRRFTMPDDADGSKIDARFEDGMLRVVIAKASAKAGKAKQIAIH